ncbi:PP2C family protein-serine/threonine phosphatase [Saccharopolyspora mangrovi]|uniref:GAF domain-containing SpoIIE family protein phosphatase n=1 Tax=Saccharopolyspora mangrovi TaxID=3082379 RepID=A0ABU6ACQ1_9PSEU|nr:GAF domain-containing SpoIIE family protein phosphatase [Saccharopolyspora sp. S2-29]MEB3369257.1 GAF domain-containing SpoIIE family protein phosphatase [Saccharopolyspora sp. S2-29]
MHASAESSAEERLRRIDLVTDTSLAHLDVNDLLREILARVRDVLGVDMATVLLLDPDGEELIATAAVGIDDDVKQGVRMPVGHGFAGTVLTDRKACVFDRVTDDLLISRALRDRGISSMAGAPMIADGEAIGVLCVGAFTEHGFTDHDAQLVQVAADRIASVSQVGSSRAERIAATVLQHSLLPGKLPSIPGASMDARYVGGADHGIGGDWYDVFQLPSGRIGIVVGDVVGHGLSAAVVMGRLRSALRAYALDDENPARVLHKLDRKVTYFEPDAMATVCYALYDPDTARLEVSLAGHLAPVMARPGGCGELVDAPVDPPVGVEVSKRQRRTTEVEVPPESVVCFYTDGLVEGRKRPIDDGLDDLCEAVTAARAGEVCASVMNQLVTSESSGDDVTLLVLSTVSATGDRSGRPPR